MAISISIIIVTYNPGEILLDCLKSISLGVGDSPYEIIVVDNASTDDVIRKAKKQFTDIHFIDNIDNRGFAGANNQGLAIARGEYFLLLNPDVILQPGSITTQVGFLKENASAGIVGPRTFDRVGNIALTANTVYSPPTILWQYLGLDRIFPNKVYGKFRSLNYTAIKPFEVNWVQGCCLLMRRQVYETIGGLDEGFFLFAEEPDFCDRAARVGWKTFFVPGSEIKHYESTVVSRFPERRIRNYHISPLHYFRKRKEYLNVGFLKIGFAIELLTKMAIHLTKSHDVSRFSIYRTVLLEVLRF